MRDLDDVPKHYLREVEHFFQTYKELEGVKTESQGWDRAAAAAQEVQASVDRHMQRMANRARGLTE
jgi:inorganic pyrophosphatase